MTPPRPSERSVRVTHSGTVVAALVALATALPAMEGQSPSTSRLVTTAADYVAAYQQAVSFLIADETSVQRVVSRSRGIAGHETATRTTRGEIFLTYLHGRQHWTAVRDVAEVDGQAVADREDYRRLLAEDDVDVVARRLFALNARFNIGRVVRNFNDPMLALLPLNAGHRLRFAFSSGRADRGLDAGLARLEFRERERPTLVRSTTGAPVYARGTITIEIATGLVRHTGMTFEYDGIDAALTTAFARDERLDLWVPVRFTERYASARDGRDELTTVESYYTNYRRFEVGARWRTP